MLHANSEKFESFKSRVWRVCRKIPWGRVSTYRELALSIGSQAFRAVGNALNKSPGMPKVPCHRVVKSDGSIGGFAHGEAEKKKLLEKEGVKVKNGRIVGFDEKFYGM